MIKRKVCVITGTRAEYGLLFWLLKEIESSKELQLQLIATGMHLSSEFGLTYKEIEKDFSIDKKIEMQLTSDSDVDISKSMGYAQASFAQAFDELKPDIIVVLGDRYEILSAVTSAMILRIPIAHIHGGETTEGVIDEAIRHSITKMSHIHFTANEEYKNRVIQLGEQPDRVFNVGGLGIENISRLELLNRDAFEAYFQLSSNDNDKKLVKQLLADSKTLHKGKRVHNFHVTDYNKTDRSIKSLIKNKNAVVYFWNPNYMSREFVASRISFLSREYPEVKFIGVQIDGEGKERIKKLDIKSQYYISSQSEANEFLSSKMPRTLLIDKKGMVTNGYASLSSSNIYNQIGKLIKD